jgi:hypothetical protein
MNPARHKYLELEIRTLQNASRDADKLKAFLKRKGKGGCNIYLNNIVLV